MYTIYCNILQCTATHCITLQYSSVYLGSHPKGVPHATRCNTLQRTATKRTATHCNTMQQRGIYLGSHPEGSATCACRMLSCQPEIGYLRGAVCCSVLQSVAVCCSVLQCVAVCCSECRALCCGVLWCGAVAVYCDVLRCIVFAVCSRVLQHVAIILPKLVTYALLVLQSVVVSVAVCCSVLQCFAVCCSQ